VDLVVVTTDSVAVASTFSKNDVTVDPGGGETGLDVEAGAEHPLARTTISMSIKIGFCMIFLFLIDYI
jgi:hypothetical protein